MRMWSVDATKCYPFGGGCRDGEGEPLPPMKPPLRSRWWAHELTVRAHLSACARGGEAGAAAGCVVLWKGTKRKGSCSSATPKRAKKRRRVLQLRSLLKNKVFLCFMGACDFAWRIATSKHMGSELVQ
jgi:hypothetical protein